MTETFIERMERIMRANNISQTELAKACGISVNGISTWKAKGTLPRADIAVSIAKVLKVTVPYLITGELEDLNEKENEIAYRVVVLPEQKKRVINALLNELEKL